MAKERAASMRLLGPPARERGWYSKLILGGGRGVRLRAYLNEVSRPRGCGAHASPRGAAQAWMAIKPAIFTGFAALCGWERVEMPAERG